MLYLFRFTPESRKSNHLVYKHEKSDDWATQMEEVEEQERRELQR